MASLHQRSIVVDGLVISNFTRPVFEDMRAGGLTAANCTCSIWEGFEPTMRNVARWLRFFDENSDILTQVHDTSDILKAKEDGKVGIILGWQNTSGYGDVIDYVPLFAKLGVRVAQLTYNTANLVGSGCYESVDRGLTDYGHDLIAAMNASGVLVDLSHVARDTARDAIFASKKPVAYTHCAPAGLKNHPRNKSDEELKLIASKEGFVGVTMFPAFLARGKESTVDDYIEAVEYTIKLVGEERVGLGTDLTQDQPPAFFDWINRDKGDGRKLVDFGEALELGGYCRSSEFPNITAAMERRGWSEERIQRVLGKNWVQFLRDVWGA
ncbi:membrane dipeptidase [Methylobacterium indicum]|uniref:Peptidase M19 n=1 Tax=Methylobacterium indicum TaxID=1775910 RepID=A0A8H9C9G8_9HYPH|nr:membrane dipeptidase [Methylobacterium indicum]BCM86731.1 peptidase M19 [Methylobacterium indicum]